MFELIHQSNPVASSIKSFYPSLGQAYMAGKKVRQSGAYKLEILSPSGKPVLIWK